MYRAVWTRTPWPTRDVGLDGRRSHALVTVSLQKDWNPPTPMAVLREWSYARGQTAEQGRLWPDPVICEIGVVDPQALEKDPAAWESARWTIVDAIRPRSAIAFGRGQGVISQYDPVPAVQKALAVAHAPRAWLEDSLGQSDRLIRRGRGVGRVSTVVEGDASVVAACYGPVERRWAPGQAAAAMRWVETSADLGRPATDLDIQENARALRRAQESIDAARAIIDQSSARDRLRDLGVPESQVVDATRVSAGRQRESVPVSEVLARAGLVDLPRSGGEGPAVT